MIILPPPPPPPSLCVGDRPSASATALVRGVEGPVTVEGRVGDYRITRLTVVVVDGARIPSCALAAALERGLVVKELHVTSRGEVVRIVLVTAPRPLLEEPAP